LVFAGQGLIYAPVRADNPGDDHNAYTRETGGDALHGGAPG
jgi:hypothetical protein